MFDQYPGTPGAKISKLKVRRNQGFSRVLNNIPGSILKFDQYSSANVCKNLEILSEIQIFEKFSKLRNSGCSNIREP